ncbi:MAG TPA: AAA family ATPase, partial [Legionella sp.]|nr:AAA family ATPase [Legionella sp.]
EIHWLIENKSIQFILCGSSARKLKTQATNLLGGRAWPYHIYPLTFSEIPHFDLLRALQQGLLPAHYLADSQYIENYLEAYVDIYLTDEIRNEGLVRNLAGFARFLDLAGLTNTQMINLNNIARDCGIDRQTVQNYYQILVDTLLGYFIYPYQKKIKRDLILSAPKFYLFDVGIANYLARQPVTALQGAVAGNRFEHYIFMELTAYLGMHKKRLPICYWRTKTGLEVDFIIGDARVAIEVKISQQVHQQSIKGLIAFCEEHPHTKAIVVSQDKRPRDLVINAHLTIHILPWNTFLTQLWDHEIMG